MAAAGARAQKPVGSAAWISTEKENCTQLVDQEMEEIEFPVRYEMEWLDEHMGEIFSNNQLCVDSHGRELSFDIINMPAVTSQMPSKPLENYEARLLAHCESVTRQKIAWFVIPFFGCVTLVDHRSL